MKSELTLGIISGLTMILQLDGSITSTSTFCKIETSCSLPSKVVRLSFDLYPFEHFSLLVAFVTCPLSGDCS